MKLNPCLPAFESTSALGAHQRDATLRILMLEDDISISRFNTVLLNRFGYEVVVAVDGEAAWAELQVSGSDLMITDNKMPKVTGLELIGKMRAARLALPVIMATGILPADQFARNPELEPDAMLLKPCTRQRNRVRGRFSVADPL